MRAILTIGILLLTLCAFSQGHGAVNQIGKREDNVAFLTKVDLKQVTKDGIYLKGYVVSITYEKLRELEGKTVRISGKVTIIKGLDHNKESEVSQGRQKDTKYIQKPKIKIIDG